MAKVTEFKTRVTKLNEENLKLLKDHINSLSAKDTESLFIVSISREDDQEVVRSEAYGVDWRLAGLVSCMIDTMRHTLYAESLNMEDIYD